MDDYAYDDATESSHLNTYEYFCQQHVQFEKARLHLLYKESIMIFQGNIFSK